MSGCLGVWGAVVRHCFKIDAAVRLFSTMKYSLPDITRYFSRRKCYLSISVWCFTVQSCNVMAIAGFVPRLTELSRDDSRAGRARNVSSIAIAAVTCTYEIQKTLNFHYIVGLSWQLAELLGVWTPVVVFTLPSTHSFNDATVYLVGEAVLALCVLCTVLYIM